MRLTSVHVQGFRSLADVGPVVMQCPTILVGHNDAGKTAFLDATAYLLGRFPATPEDLCFLRSTDGADAETAGRVDEMAVVGEFDLSPAEQEKLRLDKQARIRRCLSTDGSSRLEVETEVPQDSRFRNLESKTLADLKELASIMDVDTRGMKKPEVLAAVTVSLKGQPVTRDWTSAGPDVQEAMPLLIRFGDQDSPESGVKSTLNTRFQQYLEDPALEEKLTELRDELDRRVRDDAEALIKHVLGRCPDLASVKIEPEISFSKALKATRLHLATTDGEEVDVKRSGAGRARRVSLAIWEWASEVLRASLPKASSSEDGATRVDDAPLDGDLEASNTAPPDIVVLYDEPDTHLDYLQQRRVMKIIHEQSAALNIVVVLATHSMNLIDGAGVHQLVHLKLGGGRTAIDCLLSHDSHDRHNQHLLNIAASLGLRNTVLLHERFFLAVEGETEVRSFPVLFRLAVGRSLQAAGIALVGCHNNEGAILFAGHLVKHGRKVAFIVDGDTIKERFYSETRFASAGLTLTEHVHRVGLPDKELEYIFSDEQWAIAANVNWPRVDGRPWSATDIEPLRTGKKFSSALVELFRESSDSGPSGKPDAVFGLVETLTRAEDVPEQLRQKFIQLAELAALDE